MINLESRPIGRPIICLDESPVSPLYCTIQWESGISNAHYRFFRICDSLYPVKLPDLKNFFHKKYKMKNTLHIPARNEYNEINPS